MKDAMSPTMLNVLATSTIDQDLKLHTTDTIDSSNDSNHDYNLWNTVIMCNHAILHMYINEIHIAYKIATCFL